MTKPTPALAFHALTKLCPHQTTQHWIRPMRLFFFLALLVTPIFAWAEQITVGGRIIQIPVPEGYAPVTRQMTAMWEMTSAAGGLSNKVNLTLMPTKNVPAALAGDVTPLGRYYAVQTLSALEGQDVMPAQFWQIRLAMRQQNMQDLAGQVIEQSPAHMEDMNQAGSRLSGHDLHLGASELKIFPIHIDSDQAIAHSSLVRVSFADPYGSQQTSVVSGTTVMLHVEDRLLYLYAFGEQDDLEWTRHAAARWMEAVVQANAD